MPHNPPLQRLVPWSDALWIVGLQIIHIIQLITLRTVRDDKLLLGSIGSLTQRNSYLKNIVTCYLQSGS